MASPVIRPGQLLQNYRDVILVDAGIFGSGWWIKAGAARRFAPGARPAAIILTHGHFDHVGAVRRLAEEWDVPVYAHQDELPFLTGQQAYPPPDPAVGGGAMAALSPLYPRGPFDLGAFIHPLPADGHVPGMLGWRWVHAPGHSPGQVALFRDEDRTMLPADAFVTVKQESALAVLSQQPELHGPPAYFTPDWLSAARSVRALAALEPEIVATGHGVPLKGSEMRAALTQLATNFEEVAIPSHGRYVVNAPESMPETERRAELPV
jgi:glyoxylase-like metal-dependent hydrolase (beta-lactamase superfamily II)